MVIYFDGDCLLCNKAVQFISKVAKSKEIFFAPIGGENYQLLIQKHPELIQTDSIIVEENNQVNTKSSAVLLITKKLKWPYKILLIVSILPNSLLDKGYDFIARNRNQKTSNRETCKLISNCQILP